MRTKNLILVLVLFSLLASCNMPAGQPPATQAAQNQPVSADPNAMATAVELTAVARVTELAGSAVPPTSTSTAMPTPTLTSTSAPVAAGPCSPLVTANVNANVRSGPDTAYEVVGSLMLGQTATIVGRNDAFTWWYIDYPGVSGNHAWVSTTVVTSSCVPAVVQVVAAPPTPTSLPVADNSSGGNNNGVTLIPNLQLPLQLLLPDLVASGMQAAPSPAITGNQVDVQVKVKNAGDAAAGNFTVQWWASSSVIGCSWPVASLAKGASKVLSCSYAYEKASGKSGNAIELVVDAGNAVVETNEGNNNKGGNLVVLLKLELNPNLFPINP